MWAFFDTSAVVPLLLVEPHSGRAKSQFPNFNSSHSTRKCVAQRFTEVWLAPLRSMYSANVEDSATVKREEPFGTKP